MDTKNTTPLTTEILIDFMKMQKLIIMIMLLKL